jgi:uncharacterized protein (TIGR02996 family)
VTDEELLADVAESPNDDGPRLVYADWLQQQPDPVQRARGEYIALACSAQRSSARTARMRALLDEHEHAWLAPLGGRIGEHVWARGFVEACELTMPGSDMLGHPMWRTLRLLDARRVYAPRESVIEVICHRALSRLRVLAIAANDLGLLASSASPPQVVELAVGNPDATVWNGNLGPILAMPAFDRVRRLHVVPRWPPEQALQLQRAGLTLAVVAPPSQLPRWLDELDARAPTFEEVRIVTDVHPLLAREGFELVIRPDAERRWTQLEMRWTEADDKDLRDSILYALERVPADRLTRVTFVGPTRAEFDTPRWRTRVRYALRAQTTAQFA